MLEVVSVDRPSPYENEVHVVLASPLREEVGGNPEAYRLAVEAAAQQSSLFRPGFSHIASSSYIPEGTDQPLTEAEMCMPGRVKQGAGRWCTCYVIKGLP